MSCELGMLDYVVNEIRQLGNIGSLVTWLARLGNYVVHMLS